MHQYDDVTVDVHEFQRLAEGALDKTGDAVALADADQRADLIVGIALAGKTQAANRRAELGRAGFTDIEIEPTHAMTDGMHGAIVRAVKPL